MARGLPDFGVSAAVDLTAPAIDPGEMAVRLGSPVVFDRLGFVVHAEIGDRPLTVANLAVSAGGRGDVMAGRGLFGGYGLRLRASSSADSDATLFATLPLVATGGVGCEVVWWSDADCEAMAANLVVRHGGNRAFTNLRVNYVDGSTEYWTSAGAWTDTPTQPTGLTTAARWHSLKIVQNAVDGTWVRATFDGQELGMRGIAGNVPGNTDHFVQVTASSVRIDGSATERDVYVGALIATVNEPT